MDRNIIVSVCEGGESAAAQQASPLPLAGDAVRSVAGLSRDAGSSSNTNLPNFVDSRDLGLSNALKVASVYRVLCSSLGSSLLVLHKGLDTGEWSFRLTAEELASVLDIVVPMLGQGEQKVDGRSFVVSRIGGFAYRYLLRFPDGVEVRLPDYDFQRYGVHVKLGAKACVVEEFPEQYVIELLAWLLLCRKSRIVEALSLSRADVCMDVVMSEAEFQSMCKRVALAAGSAGRAASSVVTRANKLNPYIENGRYTGFTAGLEAIKLRCYDKKAEALQGNDWSFWAEVYSQGEAFDVPDGFVVVRFEWQMRKEFLKSFREDTAGAVVLPDGITSLDVLWSVIGNVLTYLCCSWFRFAGTPSGKDHERRSVPLWRRITASFLDAEFSRFSPGLRRRLRRHVAMNIGRLADMALGCMASIAAIIGHEKEIGKAAGFRDVSMALRRRVGPDISKWLASASQRYKAVSYAKDWRGIPVSPVGY